MTEQQLRTEISAWVDQVNDTNKEMQKAFKAFQMSETHENQFRLQNLMDNYRISRHELNAAKRALVNFTRNNK